MFYNIEYAYPPDREGSREVENLTERKNLHRPMYGVRESKCLSVKMFASKNGEMDLLRQCF